MKLFAPLFLIMLAIPVSAQIAETAACVRVTGDNVSLRGRPSATGKVVDVMAKGTRLEAIAKRDGWTLIQAADYAGWIEAKSIEPCTTDATAKPLPASTTSPVVPTAASLPPTTTITPAPTPAKTADGRTYTKGSRGGCYYINSSGKKTYVDHSLCN